MEPMIAMDVSCQDAFEAIGIMAEMSATTVSMPGHCRCGDTAA